MPPRKVNVQPTRMCVACRKKRPKGELLRLVRMSPGQVILDRQGKYFGRSAYLCFASSCVEQGRRRRLIEKHLLSNVEEGVWGELESVVSLAQNG